MSKLPNYCNVFFIFRLVRGREGWLEIDCTLLIHYKKPDSHLAALLYSFKLCAPVVFIWLWLFFSRLRKRFFKLEWRGGKEDHILQMLFPKHSFPCFNYHQINLHLCIAISEQLFCSLFSEKWIFLKLLAIIL